jgi:FKBP-type peptidyl-prolyl cis-trans isomerase SlpA
VNRFEPNAGLHSNDATAGDGRCVAPASFLTLHYRISLADGGGDVINTFGGKPATFQLGEGQLAEPLERLLHGLPDGTHAVFEVEPRQAWGERNPELVQRLSRATFDANADPDGTYGPGDVVDFNRPGGGRFAGVIKAIDGSSVLIDFNHPLAGQAVRFEVRILGVL